MLPKSLKKLCYKFTIKEYITYSLIVLTIINLFTHQNWNYLIQEAIILAIVNIIDSAVIFIKTKKITYSKSALITCLILAGIIPYISPTYTIIAAIGAVLSKHILVYKWKSVFNPAAIGALLYLYYSHFVLTWWIANPTWLVIVLGIIIALRGGFIEYLIDFSGIYVLLNTVYVLLGKASFFTIYNDYILSVVFFFFFMATDPKTMPFRKDQRFLTAIIGGIVLFIASLVSARYFLILTLLGMNFLALILNYNVLGKLQKIFISLFYA